MEKSKNQEGKLKKFKEVVERAGYTQQEVAKELQIAYQSLWRSINGKRKFKTSEMVKLQQILVLTEKEQKYFFNKVARDLIERQVYLDITRDGMDAVIELFKFGLANKDYECLKIGAECILNASQKKK